VDLEAMFQRQRRNLMLISVILILYQLAKLRFEKIPIFGIEIVESTDVV